VNAVHRLIVVALLILAGAFPTTAKKRTLAKPARVDKAQIEAATRLQVFLDRANFTPGRIDGRYNEFTGKALALYRQSRGEQPLATPPRDAKSNVAPDVSGLDLGSIDPVFIPYTVTERDLESVAKLPRGVAKKAKMKFLPYGNAGDAIAERFHSDVHFLEYLNAGKMKNIKAGDELTVPNVEPFEISSVKDIQPGSETSSQAANDIDYQAETQTPMPAESAGPPRNVSVKIDIKTNMLGVFDGEKLIAAYPVAVGSARIASPIGDWKVRGISKLPRFRYDKEMLERGERSGNFYMLPPGPRNPVGVMWIALNKKGIGIHGTDDPGSIGRAVSHGCIRLANWDVVRLATKIKPGDSVSIH
jgi:lipoprotein-anchoring transpeptidase ErfK/SrfK